MWVLLLMPALELSERWRLLKYLNVQSFTCKGESARNELPPTNLLLRLLRSLRATPSTGSLSSRFVTISSWSFPPRPCVRLRCSGLFCPTPLPAFHHSRNPADRRVNGPHGGIALQGTARRPPGLTLAPTQQHTLGPRCTPELGRALPTANLPAIRQGWSCATALEYSWKLKELWLKRFKQFSLSRCPFYKFSLSKRRRCVIFWAGHTVLCSVVCSGNEAYKLLLAA